MSKIRNIIIVSDTHFGCRFGLCPPRVRYDGGGTYNHSELQAIVWKYWNHFWNVWVPKVTKDEDYILVHNGDVIDGNHHNSTTQISHNLTDQRNIATEVLDKIISKPHCKRYYQIRGTEAHVGQSAENEEEIAKQLKAVRDKQGDYSRWDMWLRLDKALINFTHHVGTTNSAAYESTAVYKELVEAYNEAGRWHDEPPDVVVRSHRHRAIEIRVPTEKGYGISLVTPAWQLKTPFSFKIGLGRSSTPQIGGYLIREGDEDSVYTRFKIWKMDRTDEEVINV